MRRTKEDAEKTRLLIIDKALELFSENGVTQTTLNEIAIKAKVSRGAVYWHFQNKWDLFEALWEHYSAPIQQLSNISQQENENDPLGKLAELIELVFKNVATNKDFRRIIKMLWLESLYSVKNKYPDRIILVMDEIQNQRVMTLRNAYKKRQLPAEFDIQADSYFIGAAVDGIIQQWVNNPKLYDLEEKSSYFAKKIIASLY